MFPSALISDVWGPSSNGGGGGGVSNVSRAMRGSLHSLHLPMSNSVSEYAPYITPPSSGGQQLLPDVPAGYAVPAAADTHVAASVAGAVAIPTSAPPTTRQGPAPPESSKQPLHGSDNQQIEMLRKDMVAMYHIIKQQQQQLLQKKQQRFSDNNPFVIAGANINYPLINTVLLSAMLGLSVIVIVLLAVFMSRLAPASRSRRTEYPVYAP